MRFGETREVEKEAAESSFGVARTGEQIACAGGHEYAPGFGVTTGARAEFHGPQFFATESEDAGDFRAVAGSVDWQPYQDIRSQPLPRAYAASYNEFFMPVFRIHRMKDAPRQQFRSAAHVSGAAHVRPKDYEAAAEVGADNEYAAWALLRNTEQPLNVGDLLEAPEGQLRICKYVGFEEARWFVPEPPPQAAQA